MQERGPCPARGKQVYELAKLILQSQCTPMVGGGEARWNYIHIQDLSAAFLLLAEAAIAKKHDERLWGSNGILPCREW